MHLAASTVERRLSRGSVWRVFEWPIVWVAAAAAVVLGSLGFREYAQDHHEPATLLEYIYRSLQLFVLHMPHMEHALNWKVELARLLAPAVTFYTATKAFIVLFRDQLRLMAIFFVPGEIVICGLSRKGAALAQDFRGRGARVVVIEKNPANPYIHTLRREGVTVVVADARDPNGLVRARVPRCRHLIAVCEDDGVNVEIAVRGAQLLSNRSGLKGSTVTLHVHLVDRSLRELFRREDVLTGKDIGYDLKLFDTYDNNARILLREHPLDWRRIGPSDFTRVHLVILGFGQMGESLAVHAAHVAHLANGLKPLLTIVDHDAATKQKRFLHQYRQFHQACEIEFVHHDVDDPEVVRKIAECCEARDTLVYIAVCFDNDVRSLAAALRIQPTLAGREIPVMVRMSQTSGLATLLAEAGPEIAALRHMHAFGMINQIGTKEMVLNEKLDRLAKAIHADYVKRRTRDQPADASNTSLAPWDKLADSLTRSNRHQADHIPVKLRAVGCEAAPTVSSRGRKPVADFTEEEVDLMARMEHARWNAERFLNGWTLGEKNVEKKTSPYLVDWNDLLPDIQEYDREPVRNIPHLLSLIGEAVYRVAPPDGQT